MQKSKIEWTDYSVNPMRGLCPMACSYCYARAMYHRFNWSEQVEYVQGWDYDLKKIKKPSRIFVGSTMELFGTWVPDESLEYIFKVVRQYPQHTFIFLTKQPERLERWNPFPDNCWVGVSATGDMMYMEAYFRLANFVDAKVKFISLEPFLEQISPGHIDSSMKHINWLIIGQQTPVKAANSPKVEWINEIVTAADKASIPVFLKNNLWNNACVYEGEQGILFNDHGTMRQELPNTQEVKS